MADENPVQCENSDQHVCAMVKGETIADTQKALLVHETGHGPAWYFPAEDVHVGTLSKTDHSTHCPRKGDATYWTITVGSETLENAAWSYETPFAQVSTLVEYISFYTDRVDVTSDDNKHAG